MSVLQTMEQYDTGGSSRVINKRDAEMKKDANATLPYKILKNRIEPTFLY